MINKKIEIGSNYLIQEVRDVNSFDFSKESFENNFKFNIYLNNLSDLDDFKKSFVLSAHNIHVQIICTKQIFKLLYLDELLNNAFVKSIRREEKIFYVNLFILENVPKLIKVNNEKILERIELADYDIYIHSKKYEILYQATSLLKEMKKNQKKFKVVQNKLEDISNYISN